MIKINNVKIKVPSKFSVDISDIDGESNRNANGEMIRDRIATKRKLNLEWKGLTLSEISKLLKSVSNEFFEVEYPDPEDGALVKRTFYVGDRTAPMYNYELAIWENLSMNFIQK